MEPSRRMPLKGQSMTSRYGAALAGLILVSCAPSTLIPISFPAPQYKRMVSIEETATLGCATVGEIQVADERADKTLGQRYLEEKHEVTRPVTLTNDPSEWVRTGLLAAIVRAGATTGTSGQPALKVSVRRIVTEEKVFRRANYAGRVVLDAELLPPGGGTACWSGTVDGFAENYGYAGSTENYQETLNHALDRAALKLIGDPAFTKLLCGGCR
jgi:hypothetical protein